MLKLCERVNTFRIKACKSGDTKDPSVIIVVVCVCAWAVFMTCSCLPELPHAAIYSSSYGGMMQWGQGWRTVTLKSFWVMSCRDVNCRDDELCVSVCLWVREGDSGAAPVGVEATCACAPVCRSPVHAYACASALLFSCDCADLCSNHLLLGGYACFFLQEHQECLRSGKKIGLLCLRVHSAPSGGRLPRLRFKLCPNEWLWSWPFYWIWWSITTQMEVKLPQGRRDIA